MYRNKEELIEKMIEGHDLYVLIGISNNPNFGILKTDDLSCKFENGANFLIQKGRIFFKEEEAIARNNEIRELMLPYNDNRIFDVESGKLIVDVNDESILKQYNIKTYDNDSDIPIFWTIDFYFDPYHYYCDKCDLVIEKIVYEGDGSFANEDGFGRRPAVLFTSEEDAKEAYNEIKKKLIEQPHSMDYWFNGVGDSFFGVDMEEGYPSREDTANVRDMPYDEVWHDYSERENVVISQEGLYRKTDSKFYIELVLRTDGYEWHFRDNKVLIRDKWVHISYLFPLIGIHCHADIFRVFNIETEDVLLTEENFDCYVGRTLVYDIGNKWNEDFVDEDTGEVESIVRFETIVSKNSTLCDTDKDKIPFPIQATFYKDANDPMVCLTNWRGYVNALMELNYIIMGYGVSDELDAYTNVHKYVNATTRITETGRKRLDKALYNESDKISPRDIGDELDMYRRRNNVTSDDFIRIIKLLLNEGKGFNPMSTNNYICLTRNCNKS